MHNDEIGLDVDVPMILRTIDAGGFIRTNAAFRTRVEFCEAELAEEPLLHWIAAEDEAAVRAMLDRGESCRVRHRTRSGGLLALNMQSAVLEQGRVVLGRCVSDSNSLIDQQGDDATVSSTLDTIARIVEDQNPGYRCSILLVDEGRFVRGAGPSLPEDYNAAIDGYAIGPRVGSCGTAIYWNVPVIVADIQKDPLWTALAELAKGAGVAACWSHPFTAKNGRVLGALALYASEPSAPTAEQWSRLRAAARMTGLAVERGRAEEALREKRKRELQLEQQLEHAAKMEVLEQQLQQAAKMDALGALAGGVAHDFNNLLTSIVCYAGFVRDDLHPEDRRRDDIEQVLVAADRATSLTRQLLLFARRQPAERQQIDVRASLASIEHLLRRTIGEDISLVVSAPQQPLYVWGDSTQFDQILINLSINAKDAMPDGGTLRITADAVDLGEERHDLPAGSYVRLQIVDTGVGMDAATQSRSFEPFFTTKGATKGTGLGLATCYGAAKQFNGSIQVESAVGEGTTFIVYLPRFEGKELVRSPPSPDSNHLCGDETILIIEDEPSILRVAERTLRQRGYTVLTAEDGVIGLELFREHADSVDLVFSDVVLPRSSGFEVACEVRRSHPNVGMLLTTGYPDRKSKQDPTGFPIFWKPYTPAELIRRVRACLDDRASARSPADAGQNSAQSPELPRV